MAVIFHIQENIIKVSQETKKNIIICMLQKDLVSKVNYLAYGHWLYSGSLFKCISFKVEINNAKKNGQINKKSTVTFFVTNAVKLAFLLQSDNFYLIQKQINLNIA